MLLILKYISNQQHALFHDLSNRRLCYVFSEAEMAKKEKYLKSCNVMNLFGLPLLQDLTGSN